MVARLLLAGHDVMFFSRKQTVRSRLEGRGAACAHSIAELAANSDVLISCLCSDRQLRETGLGTRGFIANAKAGSVFVSHTTGEVATLGVAPFLRKDVGASMASAARNAVDLGILRQVVLDGPLALNPEP